MLKQKKSSAIQFLEWRKLIKTVVAVDIETTSLDPRTGSIRCVSIATAKVSSVMENVGDIRELLADEQVLKVFHNAAFDVHYLQYKGFQVVNYIDSMVMAQVLSNNEGSHKLSDLVELELGNKIVKSLQAAENWQGPLAYKHYLYSMCDAAITRLLVLKLANRIEAKGLYELFQREMTALPAIIRLQKMGCHLTRQPGIVN